MDLGKTPKDASGFDPTSDLAAALAADDGPAKCYVNSGGGKPKARKPKRRTSETIRSVDLDEARNNCENGAQRSAPGLFDDDAPTPPFMESPEPSSDRSPTSRDEESKEFSPPRPATRELADTRPPLSSPETDADDDTAGLLRAKDRERDGLGATDDGADFMELNIEGLDEDDDWV